MGYIPDKSDEMRVGLLTEFFWGRRAYYSVFNSMLIYSINICLIYYLFLGRQHSLNPPKLFGQVMLTFNLLGVRSLANASRARQFNPLNDQTPPGVG